MDKILRVNVGATDRPEIKTEPLNGYRHLGGRALTSAIIAKEVPPLCHPLGANNKLVIAPGLLSGTSAVCSGRMSVGCKSPLTGGIKESNSGGQGSQVLARLGYAAIVLEGKPADDTLYKIIINKDGVQVIADNSLKLLGNYDLVEKLKQAHGDNITCLSIGPAGERKMGIATIAFTDMEQRPTRHAGRGGVGAVMGAKGIKAIVLDDDGCSMRVPKDPEKFKKAGKVFAEGLKRHDVSGQGLPAFGTNMMTNAINEAGAYPTRNFSSGQFEGVAKISGETLVEIEKARGALTTHACHKGCIIKCSGTYNDKDGNFLTKQPEYETVWAHGGNCGIDDMDAIALMDRLDDDYGIDTIEMGNTIAVAMEGGLAEFGDAKAAVDMVKEVGKGSHLGCILGSGATVTGKVFSVERIPAVKGQTMPAYDPRAIMGMGVTFATSTQGADHTAGYAVASNLFGIGGKVDALKPEGQAALSRNLQIATATIDALGMCLFTAFALLDQEDSSQALIDLVNGCYGFDWTADDFANHGKSVLKNERLFNEQAGFSSKHDRLPEFFTTEPLAPHNITFQVSDEELDSVFNF